jgi:aryl-alcohol dehydrogenase-like predicted oxidoreductase
MIKGKATPEGTRRYAARFSLPPSHWREAFGLTLSSIGMGSYLGAPGEAGDKGYADSTRRALELGCNVIDTAVNYRYQRSERAIGRGLKESKIARDEVLLCTKGGFLPFDGERPTSPEDWFQEMLVKPGIVEASDIVAGCHCMTPKFLDFMIETSRKNLGVETIDVYYLHNPETQLDEVPMEEFEERIGEAFQALEKAVKAGKIQVYGTATWDGYRTPGQLSLEKLVKIAEAVGGPGHHFKVVQLPYNFAMLEAYVKPTQGKRSLLAAAAELGITVMTSVPLLQAKLLSALPKPIQEKFPGLTTNAQRCIQFVRSTPGILAPLVGMSKPAHVDENLATAKVPPLGAEDVNAILRSA